MGSSLSIHVPPCVVDASTNPVTTLQALLMAHHKWLTIEMDQGGSPSPWWALTHMVLLILGALGWPA